MFTIGRIVCRREGVFFHIENALSAGKGDGNAQCGRSMLSTIALFTVVEVLSFDYCILLSGSYQALTMI